MSIHDPVRLELETRALEILARGFSSGTEVTNCVVHAHRTLLERPDDCHLCATDVRNSLRRALRINEWLNHWKVDAAKALSELLAAALEARAAELVAAGESLPEGVSTEAFAEASLLRREAWRLTR